MFSFFKHKFKFFKSSQSSISIEEQLANLSKIGITLKGNIEIIDILDFKISDYEERPYIHLIMCMGRERDSVLDFISDVYPSNDVWCFDRECIEDHGDYVQVLKRIAIMVEPALSLTDIQDYVNIQEGKVWIAFKANSTNYRYSLSVQDDWLSPEIFLIFSELLAERGSSRRFFFADTGNEILVVLIERNQFHQLNKLINIFTPSTQT
ncbi:hypothetical protein HZF08_01085 [Paenibacillus sp. CGMCC 1.16610]|uniref:Uncharacterized protein n=1 Tax=Paenibacillus anseongense TaxID=2682845 RepID=A0ABW9U141_9BACL|nr:MULTISPECIES: hypothetical protein [Paenibacillus]MBA2936894.1 hypothetical protein [Paenibacillus sp. CGMCC 1.16610]MVQ33221.1 hypothetical protein [Paenibacillus anseongense]